MCGICGYVNYKKNNQLHVIEEMTKVLSHRGPNDIGAYSFQSDVYELTIGHVRLSILDLSAQGHQPMSYKDYVIVFNGEIYNFKEIRHELETLGHSFSSNCDTEVVLHAYMEWGDSCVERFIGMFAFAIYNQNDHILFLCRDRAGIKPLYYYYDNNVFIFGSELKAFHCHPFFQKQIDHNAVGLYMKLGYIPAPYTIFKNTYKLQQGHSLKIDLKTREIKDYRYWNLHDFYTAPKLDISYNEATEKVEEILKSSFNYRMVSDVPVGVFLSAGFDSTCVTALLQSTSSKKIKTFTIGFDSGANEAPRAKVIADYLKTDHTEFYCTIKEAQDLVKKIPFYYDEPFSDNSAIPTMLVSKLASQNVSVVLSADGGDEVFAGYSGYETLLRRYNQIKKIPKLLYKPIAEVLPILGSLSNSQHNRWRSSLLSEILKKGTADLDMSIVKSAFNVELSGYKGNMFTFDCCPELPIFSEDMNDMDFLSKLLFVDYTQYMCDDVLVKVDRATMSVSIEGRDPFLDQRIIEFAARLPNEYKFDGTIKKKILKDIVYKYVPKEIMDMPKTGFTIPVVDWLQNGLNEYVNHYLSKNEIEKSGIFDTKYIEFCLDSFIKDPELNATNIWKIMQFQMWHEKWMTN